MPVYPTQNSLPDTRLELWKIVETIDELQLLSPGLPVPAAITHPDKIQEFLASRILFNHMFPGKIISKSSQGKPLIDDQGHLSISHTRGWAAIGFHPVFRVGIDVEVISDKAFRLRNKFSHPKEWLPLQKTTGYEDSVLFSVLWSVKEALYKLLPHEGWVFKEHFFVTAIDSNHHTFKAEIGQGEQKKNWISGEFHFYENIVLVVAQTSNDLE